jgi:hypothetical protein
MKCDICKNEIVGEAFICGNCEREICEHCLIEARCDNCIDDEEPCLQCQQYNKVNFAYCCECG